MSENRKKLNELIELLEKNQELLDSDKEILLRTFVGDLNFSFLEIIKRIKTNNESVEEYKEDKKKKFSTMFS